MVDVLIQMKEQLTEHGVLELPQYFKEEVYNEITSNLEVKEEVRKLGRYVFQKGIIPEKVLHVLNTASFRELVYELTGKKIKPPVLVSFGHGEYTLLHDPILRGYTGLIDITPSWTHKWGGFISFVRENSEVIRRMPRGNSLVLVDVKNTEVFVKYVNCLAAKNRVWYVLF